MGGCSPKSSSGSAREGDVSTSVIIPPVGLWRRFSQAAIEGSHGWPEIDVWGLGDGCEEPYLFPWSSSLGLLVVLNPISVENKPSVLGKVSVVT